MICKKRKIICTTVSILYVLITNLAPWSALAQEESRLSYSFPLSFWEYLYLNDYHQPVATLVESVEAESDYWVRKLVLGAYSNWHLRNHDVATKLMERVINEAVLDSEEKKSYKRKLEGWFLYTRNIAEYESFKFSHYQATHGRVSGSNFYNLIAPESKDPLELLNLSIHGVFSRDLNQANKSFARFLDMAEEDYLGSVEIQRFQHNLNVIPSGKSSLQAGIMSTFIPGSGALYAGRRWDAIYSFVIVSGFTALAVESIINNGFKSPTSMILGTVGLSFHVGNIYGSYRRVIEYNNSIYHDLDNVSDYILDNYYIP